jgi:hypothetical protein
MRKRTKMKFKKGDIVTLLDINLAENYIWIIPLEVTKMGRKYIYGYHIYKEEGEIWRVDDSERKEMISGKSMFPGYREDLLEEAGAYNKKVIQWYQKRDEKLKEFQERCKEWIKKEIDQWMKKNPEPTTFDFRKKRIRDNLE